jgi:UDP-N-acetyl-D-mannosaminuronate dehydrogenase
MMPKESVLVVGLGEVGHALFELFKETGKFDVYGFDADTEKMRRIVGDKKPTSKVNFMHICYPCLEQDGFVKTTLEYMKKFEPKLTIIESTVSPGTTQKIYNLSNLPIVHSPIRGMHKNLGSMKRDILFWTKYVGGATMQCAKMAQRHYQKLGLRVKILKSPLETELAKLFETTYRAWMIACFQEMHRISTYFKADFDEIVDFLEDTNRVRFDRPIMFPGFIGGCLIPNAELLLKSFDSDFLRLLLKSNEKRKKELENKRILDEVEKIRKRVETLEKELVKNFERCDK